VSAQELLEVAMQRYEAHEPTAAQQALLEAYQRCTTGAARIECTSAVRAIQSMLPPRLVNQRIRRAISSEHMAHR
jgi:hypothetical protein